MMIALFPHPSVRLPIAWGIFLSSYLVFAIGRLPGTRINRTAMSIIGAVLMFAFRFIGPSQALHSIDYPTLILLFAMMLIVANLYLAGFFERVVELVVEHLAPRYLLPSVIFTSGVLSAFLVNDVVCIFMAPLILELCRRFLKPAGPYLLALAMASNIGSAATITGNPQNILIGSVSGISYRDFLKSIGPVAMIGLFIAWGILHWLYPDHAKEVVPPPWPSRTTRRNGLLLPIVIVLAVLTGFLAGFPPALVAALGGAVLFVRPSEHPERIYNLIDWSLLILFIGLFLIMGAAESSGIAAQMLAVADRLKLQNAWILSGVTALISNLVSNVPAVMLLKGLAPQFPDQHQFWLLIATASTLAGNLTITGSMANIIVVEKARAQIHISFTDYLRVGVPVTLATLLVGVLWIHYVVR